MSERIVWVLGAGFSKSLGAPLLGDLFSLESRRDMLTRYQEERYPSLYSPYANAAYALFHYGCAFGRGRPQPFHPTSQGEHLWTDAEQFLDYLDTAVRQGEKGHAFRRLNEVIDGFGTGGLWDKLIEPKLRNISIAARRVLVAECSGFLLGRSIGEERWGPYVRWARSIVSGAHDVVVTFNYDVVPDMLVSERMAVLVPGSEPTVGVAPILKLHGSVNWRKDGTIIASEEPDTALRCDADQMVIATPGPARSSAPEPFRGFGNWPNRRSPTRLS